MTQTIQMAPHEEVLIKAPGGRTIHLWLHDCESCTSLDVWTDAGRAVEEVSASTGDTTRAPVGVFSINGIHGRSILPSPVDTGDDRTCGYPAVSTAMLIWKEDR